MPLVSYNPYFTPYLIYNAPIDEKTKKIREIFKVDEETGYPEHYSWRGLAKLGKTYRVEEPFEKFTEHPNFGIQARIFVLAMAASTALAGNYFICYAKRIPWWSQPIKTLGMVGVACFSVDWLREKARDRNDLKFYAFTEYAKQHPERFEPIERYKYREVLAYWVPRR